MHLGIDFGTTRTIIAAVDRGNYPVVSFTDESGETFDYLPSVAARSGDRVVYGLDAVAAAAEGGWLLRSFKRLLAEGSVRPDASVDVDGLTISLPALVTGFLTYVRTSLESTSNISHLLSADEPLVAVVAVPAHAHSAQRFLTLDAFTAAGFRVAAMLNEPSAAGFEYTHRQSRSVNSRRTRVLVYDLGGGTFDASLVRVDDRHHEVVDSVGINRLGGDDFDAALAELALAAAPSGLALDRHDGQVLLDSSRDAKERLTPQTRRMALDVGRTPVVVDVEDFYTAVTPLVDATLKALVPLVGGLDSDQLEDAEIAGLYLVGGASSLPLVARILRERFGRRVHRSPHPAASTAIGCAIAADTDAGYQLTERLSRGFGVFREGDAGESLSFDALLSPDQRLDGDTVVVRRAYQAAHNVGVYRFVEYSRLGDAGQPTGDVVPVGVLTMPFDSALQDGRELAGVEVTRMAEGPWIEEEYRIDPHGIVEARVTDVTHGFSLTHSF